MGCNGSITPQPSSMHLTIKSARDFLNATALSCAIREEDVLNEIFLFQETIFGQFAVAIGHYDLRTGLILNGSFLVTREEAAEKLPATFSYLTISIAKNEEFKNVVQLTFTTDKESAVRVLRASIDDEGDSIYVTFGREFRLKKPYFKLDKALYSILNDPAEPDSTVEQKVAFSKRLIEALSMSNERMAP